MLLDERFRPELCDRNHSLTDEELSEQLVETRVLAGCLGALSCGALAINAYLLLRVLVNLRRGELPRKRFTFVASIAAADCLLSLSSGLLSLLRLDERRGWEPYWGGRVAMVALSALSVILYSYIGLILKQLVALRYPLHFRRWVTLGRCVIAVVGFWALELVLLGASWALASLATAKAAVLEVSLLTADLEGLVFYAAAGLIYAGTFAAVIPLREGGGLRSAGDGLRKSFFRKLGLHMALFLVAGGPHVVSDLCLLHRRLTPFAHTPTEQLRRCYEAYRWRHRGALRWLDVGLALTLVRSLLDPLLYLVTENIPPLKQKRSLGHAL